MTLRVACGQAAEAAGHYPDRFCFVRPILAVGEDRGQQVVEQLRVRVPGKEVSALLSRRE
ncbi:hypothetical protein CCO02nite_24910 [Cellulomonas composti]|uniref:Uncharacterized protein n=1 Tax=Cellulomonas composti TaxID=266130 RepID=A0A511JDN0_9CELL|nr:hypothetical protein CCO02nite_24910 [Cellulomonas composti]